MNNRKRTMILCALAALLLIGIAIAGGTLAPAAMETDFTRKNLAPCGEFLFGTDWMGRDMFARTMAGLSLSIRIGALTAGISGIIALVMGVSAALLGRAVDGVVSWGIDLVMGIPHILLIMLISLACGKGFKGVVIGVAITHWPSLARVIRGEVMQLGQAPYILAAEKLGASRLQVAKRHMLPHLLPQFLVGMILQFPHAILHEASITFLGFGLPPEQPAIGVILSESMRYLSTGKWWLGVFPGLALVLVVLLFAMLGDRLRQVLNPSSVHE